MRVYKWENLKLKACQRLSEYSNNQIALYGLLQSLEQNLTGMDLKSWRNNSRDIREKAWNIIENWDIRKAKTLINLFPAIIAYKYRNETPICDYNDNGSWCLIYN